ncbi:Uncharacterized protein Adt_48055 [Abeliophyllum distichum]|uniref:Bulb-type lectin domain-containing protein n=1 Tax=Abeliophyllum distichum TaxID=126358 RepID=A0ABD1NS30_9LAMI
MFLLPLSATAQPYRNVTLGSALTANNASSTCLSPSGEFAFGFQKIIPGGYLLAIWFNKIPERTIVWSANRDNLIQEGSKVQLFADGKFELSDRGQRIWAATLSRVGVAYGTLVIFNQSGYIFLIAENGSLLNFVASNATSTSQFYQRAILEYDGVLRHYVYPRSAYSEGGRAMAWSIIDFIPSNICMSIRQRTGGGACGFNSF